jgi:hypothetical protein
MPSSTVITFSELPIGFVRASSGKRQHMQGTRFSQRGVHHHHQ